MTATRTGTWVLDCFRRLLQHHRLPTILAIGAILIMLPALKLGFMLDDLPQRAVELRPDQLPPRIHDTGNPANSGSLSTVLRDLFYNRNARDMALSKNYGTLAWWAPDDLRVCLWRPVTAFTHWLDYQLFPNSPALMHAHNIAWFAAIAFLLTILYRKLIGNGWAAGFAALLFLLDGHTYFPVAYVANRGFLLSLFFGLLCLYEHYQWRSAKSRCALVLSALFLALSVLADESGASGFAFILAYALVLEPGSFRSRAVTLLPSILVIVLWRIIYTLSGFGIFHMGLYIDPASEPLEFGRQVIPRAMILLGSQLSGIAPDFLFAVNPQWHSIIVAFFWVFAAAVLMVFLPWVRRDKTAAFWFAIMILAAIPAATVMPLRKNLGFVAIGAYGVIASFTAGLMSRSRMLPESLACRIPAWIACVLLLLIHVPGAAVGRVVAVKSVASDFNGMNYLCNIDSSPDAEDKNVIVVNAPFSLVFASAPFYKAYHHQSLPKSMRMLVPGCTSLDIQRTDDKTLVIQSRSRGMFSCDDVGPIHPAYAFNTFNRYLCAPRYKEGNHSTVDGFTVEILELDAVGLPSRVAFRFDTSLDSPDFRWLRFEWPTWSYRPFKLPAIGQSVTLPGPRR